MDEPFWFLGSVTRLTHHVVSSYTPLQTFLLLGKLTCLELATAYLDGLTLQARDSNRCSREHRTASDELSSV